MAGLGEAHLLQDICSGQVLEPVRFKSKPRWVSLEYVGAAEQQKGFQRMLHNLFILLGEHVKTEPRVVICICLRYIKPERNCLQRRGVSTVFSKASSLQLHYGKSYWGSSFIVARKCDGMRKLV